MPIVTMTSKPALRSPRQQLAVALLLMVVANALVWCATAAVVVEQPIESKTTVRKMLTSSSTEPVQTVAKLDTSAVSAHGIPGTFPGSPQEVPRSPIGQSTGQSPGNAAFFHVPGFTAPFDTPAPLG